MKNLEIKAAYSFHSVAVKAIKTIKAKYIGQLVQKDIYYRVPCGRLKLRSINKKQHELIYYHRPERRKARYSSYEIIRIKEPHLIDKIFSKSLGRLVVVEKKRELYVYQNVRIHLDTVKKLGSFLEFEIVCRSAKDEFEAPKKMKFLLKKFGISSGDLIAASYSDLLSMKKN